MGTVRKASIVCVVAAFLAASAAFADSTGKLRLAFEDEQGKPLEGVSVVIVFKEARAKHELKSDNKGHVSRIGLNVGSYDVEVSYPGLMTLTGSIAVRLAGNSIEGGFAQESLPEGTSWETNKYLRVIMLKGAAAATGALIGGVEISGDQAKLYTDGQDALKAGDYAKAREFFERIAAEKPELPHTYFFLYEIYNQAGELDKAFESLKKGLELKPDMAGAQATIGKLYEEKNETEAARKAYRAALALDPNLPGATRDLGLLELRMENWGEAKKLLSKYVEMAQGASDVEWISKVVSEMDTYAKPSPTP